MSMQLAPNPTPPPSQASIAPATGVPYPMQQQQQYPPGSTNAGVATPPPTAAGYGGAQQQSYSNQTGYTSGFVKQGHSYTQRAYQAYQPYN